MRSAVVVKHERSRVTRQVFSQGIGADLPEVTAPTQRWNKRFENSSAPSRFSQAMVLCGAVGSLSSTRYGLPGNRWLGADLFPFGHFTPRIFQFPCPPSTVIPTTPDSGPRSTACKTQTTLLRTRLTMLFAPLRMPIASPTSLFTEWTMQFTSSTPF